LICDGSASFFIDGEGCFIVGLFVSNKYKRGYQVQLIFKISLHNKDFELLSQIQSYFGVVNITKHGDTTMQYCVKSSKDLSIINSHFDKYPLISQKRADYELFKQVAKLFKNKEHLTADGFKEILSIRAAPLSPREGGAASPLPLYPPRLPIRTT
jgi:hypothetical protein